MKKFGWIALLLLSMLLCSCSPRAVESTSVQEAAKVPQIGLSMDSFVIERWQRDRDVFVAHAKELGMEVLVQDAGGVVSEQQEQIRYFIKKGVQAIVIVAVDGSSLKEVVQEARAANIRVIAYDRMILDAPVDLYISFDNEQVGRLMAQNLVDNVRKGGKIACINGSDTDNNVTEVRKGFLDVIGKSTLEIVYTAYCHNWEAEDAYNYVQQLLQEGIAFDGIMCGNDDLASMVYKALSERALLDSVFLVGQDADLAACQRIVVGWQSMTVHKRVEDLACRAAESVSTLINGGTVDAPRVMSNGMMDVPSILLEPIAVTAENMDSIVINSGFHTRDDVYANVRQK
ncbi:MAG: substrate-binding domain-containing protein [Eubacteriales bacterium]|nr:substrate-binding domain-containing protein [Eubacteriales bacterium]